MKPTPEFNATKAAQVVAFFATKGGGEIDVLKVVKLLYLADRKFLADYDEPILFDRLVSMDHGPVDSMTYDLISGVAEDEGWDRYVSDRADHRVAAKERFGPTDLDQLSPAELDCLESIWQEFGRMGKWAIRDYTHDHCPEWEDPHGSSAPIPYARILRTLGKSAPTELAERIQDGIKVARILATL